MLHPSLPNAMRSDRVHMSSAGLQWWWWWCFRRFWLEVHSLYYLSEEMWRVLWEWCLCRICEVCCSDGIKMQTDMPVNACFLRNGRNVVHSVLPRILTTVKCLFLYYVTKEYIAAKAPSEYSRNFLFVSHSFVRCNKVLELCIYLFIMWQPDQEN